MCLDNTLVFRRLTKIDNYNTNKVQDNCSKLQNQMPRQGMLDWLSPSLVKKSWISFTEEG